MSKYQCNVNNFSIEKDEKFFAYINVVDANRIVKLLNEQDERIQELEHELNAFKPVVFQDMRKGTILLYTKDYEDEDEG